jgi:uncharacterized membrane protein
MNKFLQFFAVEDWFNRPGPYGFNLERIILLFICVFLIVFIPIKLKNRADEAKKALVFFWLFALSYTRGNEIAFWFYVF